MSNLTLGQLQEIIEKALENGATEETPVYIGTNVEDDSMDGGEEGYIPSTNASLVLYDELDDIAFAMTDAVDAPQEVVPALILWPEAPL